MLASSHTYGKHNRHPAPHRLRSIRLRLLANPQLLIPSRILPADDRSAKEQHLDAISCWQHGRDAVVGVRDCYLGLGSKTGRGGEGGGFLWAVDHVGGAGAGADVGKEMG